MSLGRTWARQLFEASGAALLAPVTILAALCALTLSGGLGALGDIGQALSGPRLPVASTERSGGPSAASALLPVLLASGAGGVPAGVAAASKTALRGVPAVGQPAPATRSGGVGDGGGVVKRPGGRPITGSGSGSGGGTAGSPLPAPAPGGAGRLVGAATGITARLPGPVGALGAQALQGAANTLDGALLGPAGQRLP